MGNTERATIKVAPCSRRSRWAKPAPPPISEKQPCQQSNTARTRRTDARTHSPHARPRTSSGPTTRRPSNPRVPLSVGGVHSVSGGHASHAPRGHRRHLKKRRRHRHAPFKPSDAADTTASAQGQLPGHSLQRRSGHSRVAAADSCVGDGGRSRRHGMSPPMVHFQRARVPAIVTVAMGLIAGRALRVHGVPFSAEPDCLLIACLCARILLPGPRGRPWPGHCAIRFLSSST